MGNPQNVTPRSVWRGSQKTNSLLDTPEVRLEAVRNAVTTFSTTPRSIWRGAQNPESGKCAPEVRLEVPKRWIPLWTPPRFVWRG